jgi:hypothetical protein
MKRKNSPKIQKKKKTWKTNKWEVSNIECPNENKYKRITAGISPSVRN